MRERSIAYSSLGSWMFDKLPLWLNMIILLGIMGIVWFLLLIGIRVHFERVEFYEHLASEGAAATGVIIRAGQMKLSARYDFTVTDASGTPVTIHAEEVTNWDLYGLKPGDTVPLHYDPADPSASRLDANPYLLVSFGSVLLGLSFILVTLVDLVLIFGGVKFGIYALQKRFK